MRADAVSSDTVMTRVAIVTGASSGLGLELVRQLEAGALGPLDEIWAVSRHPAPAAGIVRPLALDLTDPVAPGALRAALDARPDVRVVLLVNNAGFGSFGDFADIPARDNAEMVRLLTLAPVELTQVVLPRMCPGSCILNVASVAGFVPQPQLAVYSAAKRFVLDLSRALNVELEPRGITVTALCPKFMRTAFMDHVGEDDVARRMALLTGFERPERVARHALRAMRARRVLCIPSPYMRVFYALAKLMPYPVLISLESALMGRFGERAARDA